MSESPWYDIPTDLLHYISRYIPCKVSRVRMLAVCRSWRTSLIEDLPPLPLPPQLPWLLRPCARGPTFSCLLCDADELSVHRVRVPADLRDARYFGSYDGGWLFLTYGRTFGNMLVNLRTERRFRLPDVIPSPSGADFPVIMLAATLSSPPSDVEEDRCFGAAIVHCSSSMHGPRHIILWLMGHHQAMRSIPPEQLDWIFSQSEMEDVIYHNGAFHFLSTCKNIVVCTPELHQGALQVHQESRLFLRHGVRFNTAAVRYLVESRGQLLMVVKTSINLPGQPPWEFNVFQMTHLQAPVGEAKYTWTLVPKLGGRMLFIGHGCSRSYEVAD
ncbi:hypothetical protein GUJ93_ZPchr0010g7455 [Zizania palustris]|uniref:KIB1-4 beta-propeller domain-containing protein n=1 Tax=Zizania palustris TaxID=103762 RepID=A0A8J6BJM2_ZIZPA|nr:hypothetical protein GUJ93_ZPchr0010g7455 [Zizania palustris]